MPRDFELVLPVRFRDEDGNRINLGEWIPANNFWGRFLEGLKIERKQDLKSIVLPRPSGSLASHARSIMQHMTDEQLKVIEREMLFVKEPVVGENIHYRLDRQGDHFLAFNHLNKRREKFAQPIVNPPPFAEGQLPVELEYVEGHQIHRDNLLWKDKKYVIPMRLLHNFFAVSSEISTDMLITFNIEQEVKKLFEAVFTREIRDDVERGRRDRDPPRLQIIFYETPKINYNLYTYSPQKQSIEHMAMSQIKGKRTGLQPVYHERNVVIRQGGFGASINFNNAGTQFEWLMVSIIPVLSKIHRNTYTIYNNEVACNTIRKLSITDIKDQVNNRRYDKIYDLENFDDQFKLYRQYCAYISNRPSNQTMLDFSKNQEVQQTVQLRDYFTTAASERLYIDMRDSLGATGKKDAMKRNDSSVKVEISLKEAAPHDLDIMVFGQGYGEYVFESNSDGNMIQFFEYKVVEDDNSKKLNEVTYRESKSRKRKWGIDRECTRVI